MSGYQVLTVLGGPLGLYGVAVVGLLTLVTCIVVVVVYITASCKLQSVLEATMQGSASGGGNTTDSTSRSHASSSSTSSILANTKSWMRKNSGAKGQKRHKHLATIMKAARGIVVCLVFYILGVVGYGIIPTGFVRTSCSLVLFAMAICTNIVLLRYYRAAIMSGATRRRGNSTDAGGTSENNTVTSVVPVSAASTVGEELETKNSFTESNSSTDTPSSASGSTDAPGLPGTVNSTQDSPTTALRKLIDGE
jgi:hypothetical protein